MHDNLKDQLVLLRQRIPIGLRHGQVLLENTNGNIDEAEHLFKKETIATLIEKTGVSHDTAKLHLEKNKYDIASALKAIDEEQHSLSERILRRYQHNS
jgi:hypothetical protein